MFCGALGFPAVKEFVSSSPSSVSESSSWFGGLTTSRMGCRERERGGDPSEVDPHTASGRDLSQTRCRRILGRMTSPCANNALLTAAKESTAAWFRGSLRGGSGASVALSLSPFPRPPAGRPGGGTGCEGSEEEREGLSHHRSRAVSSILAGALWPSLFRDVRMRSSLPSARLAWSSHLLRRRSRAASGSGRHGFGPPSLPDSLHCALSSPRRRLAFLSAFLFCVVFGKRQKTDARMHMLGRIRMALVHFKCGCDADPGGA